MWILFGGIPMLAQGARVTTQFDLWNRYSVKTPAPAQGVAVEPSDDETWYMASNNGLYISHDGGGLIATGNQGARYRFQHHNHIRSNSPKTHSHARGWIDSQAGLIAGWGLIR